MAGITGWPGAPEAAAAAPGQPPLSALLSGGTSLQADFAAAAKRFGVPESVLLTVAYQESLWESHGGLPSVTGNYNVMGLTQLGSSGVENLSATQRRDDLDQRGKPSDGRTFRPSAGALARVNQVPPADPALHSLETAAALIHAPAATARTSMRQSVMTGAALLAHFERAISGKLPVNAGQWYPAVARYSEATSVSGAALFADRVYSLIRTGASRITADGQRVTLSADPSVKPDRSSLSGPALLTTSAISQSHRGAGTAGSASGTQAPVSGIVTASTPAPECPPSLNCGFVPAAYSGTSGNYGNYDVANRPADGLAIRYIVIHDTEGSYSGTISAFQDPTTFTSAHYVVQSSTGAVTQMVQTKDIAWDAGNWYVNAHAIGIENEGYALAGATWYTPSEYQSTAALVKYLAALYNIPVDRQHIIGHDDVPGPLQTYVAGMHWDPGPYWDWNYFMQLAGGPISQPAAGSLPVGSEITIDPPFSTANEPTVTGCSGPGTPCPAQPANFVYLRTSPSPTAPLLADPAIHPSAGSTGTTEASDWGDKAVSGQTFVVADEQGGWTAIWYAGQKAWFYNPNGQNATPASRAIQMVITPSGNSSIPVYGRAYPESAAYPPGVTPQSVTPLSYTIPSGQAYVPEAATMPAPIT